MRPWQTIVVSYSWIHLLTNSEGGREEGREGGGSEERGAD